MAKYFSMAEMCASSTAEKKGIANIPDCAQQENILALMDDILDPIRIKWGSALTVNSGFRSAALNAAVGGAATSQHCANNGAAADITAGNPEKNEKLYAMIQEMGLDFDQLIDEYGYSWIHISYKKDGPNRGMVFKIS